MSDTACFIKWPINVKELYRVFKRFFKHLMLSGEFVVDKQRCGSWIDHGCYFSGTVLSFQITRNMEVGFTTMGFGNSYRVKCCIRVHHLRHCYMWSNQDTCTTNVHLIRRCRWWSRNGTRRRKMRNKAFHIREVRIATTYLTNRIHIYIWYEAVQNLTREVRHTRIWGVNHSHGCSLF